MNKCENKECPYYKDGESCGAEDGCGGYYESEVEK